MELLRIWNVVDQLHFGGWGESLKAFSDSGLMQITLQRITLNVWSEGFEIWRVVPKTLLLLLQTRLKTKTSKINKLFSLDWLRLVLQQASFKQYQILA